MKEIAENQLMYYVYVLNPSFQGNSAQILKLQDVGMLNPIFI